MRNKSISFIIILVIFLSGCTSPGIEGTATIEPTLTPLSTPTISLIPTITSTSQPTFRAGPDSMIEGQYNQLHWSNLHEELDLILPVLRQYMVDVGINEDDVATFTPYDLDVFQSEYFPYGSLRLTIPTNTILGYSILTMPSGTEMLTMHFPIRRIDSQDIVIVSASIEEAPLYWEQRLENGFSQSDYELNNEPSIQFALLASDPVDNPLTWVDVYLNIPNVAGSEWLDEFPETGIILEQNNLCGVYLNSYLGAQMLTDLERELWENTLEHQILPARGVRSVYTKR